MREYLPRLRQPDGDVSRTLMRRGEGAAGRKGGRGQTPSWRITTASCAPQYHKQPWYYNDPAAPPHGPVPCGAIVKELIMIILNARLDLNRRSPDECGSRAGGKERERGQELRIGNQCTHVRPYCKSILLLSFTIYVLL